jgi:HK97 family phage prohead protease
VSKRTNEQKAQALEGLIERREVATGGIELRQVDANGQPVLRLSGYASRTEIPYEVGFYTETIKRGAFKRTLGENPDVQLLVNHSGLPLARTRSGTLRLSEDDLGLRVEADLDPDDADVEALARKMRRGDIDQMSFAFRATDQKWNEDYTQRTLLAVSIHRGDVSVVNMGANEASTAQVRSRDKASELVSPEQLRRRTRMERQRVKELRFLGELRRTGRRRPAPPRRGSELVSPEQLRREREVLERIRRRGLR